MLLTLRFALVLIAICPTVLAQSSDNPKYYILYDISGSTSHIDKQGNLNKLLLRTIGRDPNSFEIVFFGTETTGPDNIDFDLPSLSDPDTYARRQRDVHDKIERLSKTKRHNQYSHIHAALDAINSNVRNASGVFIFTDGRLLAGDINPSLNLTIDAYNAKVAASLRAITDAKIPIFLIQSSKSRVNPYFKFPEGNSVDARNSVSGDDFFWMYNGIRPDSVDQTLELYDEFMAHAHDKMMNLQEGFVVKPNDIISTMVALHEIDVRIKALNVSNLRDSGLLPTTIDAATIGEIQKVHDNFNTNSLTLQKAEETKAAIESLNLKAATVTNVLRTLDRHVVNEGKFGSAVRAQTLEPNVSGEARIDVTAAESLLSGGLEQQVIEGLTRYLIKRTEQEALFFLFDNLDKKIELMSPYFKDTLFQNTYSFIKRFEKYPDLLLVKEALNKDINDLHDNLVTHPGVRESDGLVALSVVYTAFAEIQSSKTLENAFEAIKVLTDTWAAKGPSKTRAEKSIVLLTRLIELFKQYNLTTTYEEIQPQQLEFISREIIVFFGTSGDYAEVQLKNIEEKVSALYKQYYRTRKRIEFLQSSFPTTQQDYEGWLALKRNILVDVLKEVAGLITASIDLSSGFIKAGETADAVRKNVALVKDNARNMIDSWFLIKDQQYVEAVVNLLPVISDVIQANPNLDRYVNGTLASHVASLKKNIILNKQLVQWNVDEIRKLKTKFIAAKQEILRWNSGQAVSLEEYKKQLARVNLSELEVLIEETKIPDAVVTALDAFLSATEKTGDPVKLKKIDFNFQIKAAFALRYLTFSELNEKVENMITIAAEVSTAVEADDITQVLLKYSMPPASYRAKRQERATLMINAYTGVGSNFVSDRILNISAPLGLEVSLRFKGRNRSISLLATPVDLGNVINYEVLGDGESDDNVFKWKNIYSPGAFIVFGLSRNHPFAAGLGYQANPDRASLFIAFDLPIFRIR